MSAARPRFLSVPLDPLTMHETLARCRDLVASGRAAQHVVLNAGKCVLMEDEPDLRSIVAACDLVNADGQGVVWGARLHGIRVPERVAGIDLMERLLEIASAEGWPVYFLGAKEDVLADFESEVRRRLPTIVVAGRRHGYFRPEDESAIADSIRASGARLLFVAMSSPLKERFLARQMPHLGPVLAMGVGGSFDVWAGRTKRAPRVLQRAGLEWLYRFLQEPRRMWKRYLLGNARFVWLVVTRRPKADEIVG